MRPEKRLASRSSGARREGASHTLSRPPSVSRSTCTYPRSSSESTLLGSCCHPLFWSRHGWRSGGGGRRRREEEERTASTHSHRTQGTATGATDTGESISIAFHSSRCPVRSFPLPSLEVPAGGETSEESLGHRRGSSASALPSPPPHTRQGVTHSPVLQQGGTQRGYTCLECGQQEEAEGTAAPPLEAARPPSPLPP